MGKLGFRGTVAIANTYRTISWLLLRWTQNRNVFKTNTWSFKILIKITKQFCYVPAIENKITVNFTCICILYCIHHIHTYYRPYKKHVLYRLFEGFSSVGICDGLRTGRPGFDSWQEKEFALLHSVRTGSGAHRASYRMGTGGKAAGAWSWPLTFSAEVKKGGAVPQFPHMSSWYIPWLIKYRGTFTFVFNSAYATLGYVTPA
jgi:hypothetical protein